MEETQAQVPVSVPDVNRIVPQADPASPVGPDSHNMARLSDRASVSSVDWEARYKGMDALYQKEVQALKGQVATLVELVKGVVPAAQPAPAQPVSSPAPATPVSNAIQQIEAQLYRDRLLDTYTQKGEPGEGLPLHLFKANIPVVAPVIGADGRMDDSGQRAAITGIIGALKGVQTSAATEVRQVLTQGTTPGAPGAKPPAMMSDGDTKYEEFKSLMVEMSKAAFIDLSAAEQAAKTKRYYELLRDSDIQSRHGGQTQPSLDWTKLSSQVQRLTQEVESLRNRGA
jgi:hypothetical protein